MEKSFGDGRVVVELCKLSPKPTELGAWSNLSLNPVFPVFANELIGYLSARAGGYDVRGVDQPVIITAEESQYLPEVRVRAPGAAESGVVAVVPDAKDGKYTITAPGEVRSGVWEFQLTTREGKPETRYVAVNVPAAEGDLHLLRREELTERLRGVDYEYSLASQFTDSDDRLEGSRIGDALLYALIAALVGEQLLAASASYHVSAQRKAA